jgi:exodeoxyribonuclease-3
VRIATWNINGTKARLGYVEAWLTATKPDVVGLQELKTTDDKFPTDELRELGYHSVTHGQKSWNGVAILSKEEPEVVQRGLPGQEEMGARLITAKVSGLTFTTVYVPNGKDLEHEDFAKKLAFLDDLAAYCDENFSPDEPHVLCGDFNVVPAPIDSWNEEYLRNGIFHTEDERKRIARFLDMGFVDSWRARYPDKPGFTWWDYRGGAFHRKQGLRIDLLLVTEPLADEVTEVSIERDWRKKLDGMIPSDHAPVWADLNLTG